MWGVPAYRLASHNGASINDRSVQTFWFDLSFPTPTYDHRALLVAPMTDLLF